jgi:hypothetical protein
MPICGCGCEQTLGRRQVKRHMETKVTPRLVTAAVAQFRMLGTSVSAPRLEHSKKRRSSRRHLPPLPEPPSEADEAAGPPPADMSDDGMNIDQEENGDVNEDEQEVQRIVGCSQQGIWSGRHHRDDDEEDDDDESDKSGEGSEGDGYDDWEVEEGLENSSGLSALDRIGEDFERNATVNGESSQLKWLHNTTNYKACIYRWKTQ